MNDAQREAVQETTRPTLVLAGPGTGKTSMLVAKYAHLVLNLKIDPSRILITTFTTKATAELEERITDALAEARHYSKIEVSNFHSFCLQLLQEFGDRLGLSRDPPVLDGIALTRFLHENKDRFDWQYVPYIRWIHGPLENLTKFTGRCLSEGFDAAEALRRAETYANRAPPDERRKALEYTDYARNYAQVLELLAEKRVLTYDLMLYHAVQLLEGHADIRKEIQGRFDYVLVDEVQDNSGLQTRLVELISDKRPATMVGDEDQGIYMFRGARKDNLRRLEATFKPHVVNLWENYRSSAHIVEAAKAVIRNNPDRFEGKRLEARGKNKDLAGLVEVLAVPNEDQEAIRIVRMIQDEVRAGRRLKDIAVIYRSLNHKARLLEELEAAGLAYEVTNTGELLRAREVRDLWAWMSTLNDPYTDNPSFARVLSSREVGIPLLDLGRIQARLRRIQEEKAKEEKRDPKTVRLNLVDVLRDLEGAHIDDESRHRLRWTRRTLEVLSEKTRGLDALDTAYEVLGWLRPQRRFPPSDVRSRQVWSNLGHFLQVVKDYETNYPDAAGLAGFLEYLDYLDRRGAEFQDGDVDEGQDSIKVLTAHGAKGLQFPVVFVASCCKQRFPSGFRGEWMHPILDPQGATNPGDIHAGEERRVFYVAITRAEQRLVLTHPLTVGGKERARSIFLDEMLDGAPQHVQQTTTQEELPPASESANDSEAWIHDLHAATLVHAHTDAAEAKDRVRRVVEATLGHWQRHLPTDVLSEVATHVEALGAKPPTPVPESRSEAGHLHLSASALNTYGDCPMKFHFQQNLHIPSRINAAAVAGSNVHRALEVFHREHKTDWRTCTTQQLLEVYERVAAESRFSTPKEAQQFRDRDRRILEAYLDTERSTPGEPTHFEVPYHYDIPELDAEFGGYIDRVDEHPDGSVEVIDYKTGKRESPNKIVTEDYQIPLYVLALEEGKKRTVKAGSLYWMRDAGDGDGPIQRDRIPRVAAGKKGQFSNEAMQAFKTRLATTVNDIRCGRFPPKPDEFGCRTCDYRILCPAWGN